jgi:hypothetical protein
VSFSATVAPEDLASVSPASFAAAALSVTRGALQTPNSSTVTAIITDTQRIVCRTPLVGVNNTNETMRLIDAVKDGMCAGLVGTCDVSIVAQRRRALSSHNATMTTADSNTTSISNTTTNSSNSTVFVNHHPPPPPPASVPVLLEAQRTFDYVASASQTNLSASSSERIAAGVSSLGVTVDSVVLTALSVTVTITAVGSVTGTNLVDTLESGAIAAGFAAQLPWLNLTVSAPVVIAPPLPPPEKPPPAPPAPPAPHIPNYEAGPTVQMPLAFLLPLILIPLAVAVGIGAYLYYHNRHKMKLMKLRPMKDSFNNVYTAVKVFRGIRGTDQVLPPAGALPDTLKEEPASRASTPDLPKATRLAGKFAKDADRLAALSASGKNLILDANKKTLPPAAQSPPEPPNVSVSKPPNVPVSKPPNVPVSKPPKVPPGKLPEQPQRSRPSVTYSEVERMSDECGSDAVVAEVSTLLATSDAELERLPTPSLMDLESAKARFESTRVPLRPVALPRQAALTTADQAGGELLPAPSQRTTGTPPSTTARFQPLSHEVEMQPAQITQVQAFGRDAAGADHPGPGI